MLFWGIFFCEQSEIINTEENIFYYQKDLLLRHKANSMHLTALKFLQLARARASFILRVI